VVAVLIKVDVALARGSFAEVAVAGSVVTLVIDVTTR